MAFILTTLFVLLIKTTDFFLNKVCNMSLFIRKQTKSTHTKYFLTRFAINSKCFLNFLVPGPFVILIIFEEIKKHLFCSLYQSVFTMLGIKIGKPFNNLRMHSISFISCQNIMSSHIYPVETLRHICERM